MIPKFRAWHKTWEEMGKVKRIRFDDDGNVTTVLFKGKTLGTNLKIDEIELMQSTGLKDKNGQEIFEGDVVQYQNIKVPSADSEGVIRYFDNWAMFGIDIEHKEPRALFFSGLADHISLEVVGNIYETPELLEADHDRA